MDVPFWMPRRAPMTGEARLGESEEVGKEEKGR
jgi:hypothetical protein